MNIASIIGSNTKIRGSAGKRPKGGLVFIPDISGFTEMVLSTDLLTGQKITYELLSTIIEHNGLGMRIAEIEGDAVFFYKWKSTPSVDALYALFERLKTAFDDKITELEERYHIRLDMHLKAIAHYGDMAEYSIGGFRKLYGEVVVESHRLLKNSVPGNSYLLVTDELAAATEQQATDSLFYSLRSRKLCELYGGLRNLCFTYILFETLPFST